MSPQPKPHLDRFVRFFSEFTAILPLGEQRHNVCEQFAQDCYPTASRLQFEPGPFCARVQHAYLSATEPPLILLISLTELIIEQHSG